MKSGPCRDCQERNQGCHDRCPSYISWKREWEASKEYLKEQTVVYRSKSYWKHHIAGKIQQT